MKRLLPLLLISHFCLLMPIVMGCDDDNKSSGGKTTFGHLFAYRAFNSPQNIQANNNDAVILIVELINTVDPNSGVQSDSLLIFNLTLKREFSASSWYINPDTRFLVQDTSSSQSTLLAVHQTFDEGNTTETITFSQPIFIAPGQIRRLVITEDLPSNANGTMQYSIMSMTVQRVGSNQSVEVKGISSSSGIITQTPVFVLGATGG